MDVVSDSEEAAGGNEDPGPTNDKEMKKRRNGERTRDRGIRYVQIVSETEFERQDLYIVEERREREIKRERKRDYEGDRIRKTRLIYCRGTEREREIEREIKRERKRD